MVKLPIYSKGAAGTTAMRVRLDNLKLEVMLLLLHPGLGMLELNLDLQGQLPQ